MTADRVRFWQRMTVAGPIAALIGPPLLARLLGGFVDFQMVGKEVSAAETFGILGAMCFPPAAYWLAEMKCNEAWSRLAATWPTVPGKVRSTRVEERKTGREGILRALTVDYSYTVGGQRFQGEMLGFGPRWIGDDALVESLIRKYPADAEVAVHVDPADPAMAVLETSTALARQRLWRVWVLVCVPLAATVVMAIRHAGS